ncbi:MAG: hypothetical protein GX139_00120 [Armatimonadetes bacterium]|nr:hypothetical protein [Armatimonadota bacterium]
MNALPVGPGGVGDYESRTRYFNDLERLGFDIPFNAYYASLYTDVVGRLRPAYIEFAAEAHNRHYPACIQIQVSVCAGDRVGVDQAQRNVDNQPELQDNGRFFASFSSKPWLNYLKELTTIFVQQYGYDWVVFEEPMYRVDIPGAQDPFYADFSVAHPDVAYPSKPAESTEYLIVQQAKAEALHKFCRELAVHAKSVGAKKVGIMPWFFIPTIENTPPETHNPSCQVQHIAAMPELDFIVVRMQPDNIYCDTMRTGDDLTASAKLYHCEIMAHSVGKDLIAVNNPTDEHTDYPSCPLIPFDFFRDYTLAGIAAGPCGFTRHWYGQNYGKEEQYMQLLAEAASYAGRLGHPCAPVAFVFSHSGTQHAEPYTYETVFPFYWDLVRQLHIEHGTPVLTFFADTLEADLARHPEVQLLIMEEHFPLTYSQLMAVGRWWRRGENRGIVAFGAGLGFCADVDYPGLRPSNVACPSVFELLNLKQDDPPQYILDEPVKLRNVSRIRRGAFLGDEVQLNVNSVSNVHRVFGSRASVLYELDALGMHIPVVSEWREREVLALYCGFGVTKETIEEVQKAVLYALHEIGYRNPPVTPNTKDILWSVNRHDYIVISNLSDQTGSATIKTGRSHLWDCKEQKYLADGVVDLALESKSFKVLRLIGRRSKFLDIQGVSCLRNMRNGVGKADIEFLAGKTTTLVLRAAPKEIFLDGKHCAVTQEVKDEIFYVSLQGCMPGEHKLTLKW